MTGRLFISYSAVDAGEFALRLADELAAGPPSFPVWIDKRDLRPGEDWGEQIVEAIRSCKSLIFVITADSVQASSVCKDEWMRALRYKKPIIPLLAHGDAEPPFRLESREYIDFTGSQEAALARLRKHLEWMDSPQGQLQQLRYRLADAQRELPRAKPEQQARIRDDTAELERQIAQQQAVLADPEAAKRRVQERVEQGLDLMRQPVEPVSGIKQAKFINPPPAVAPTWFQDRHVETKLMGDFLRDEGLRLMTVVGRGGIGKSAMVCRLLKSLEAGQLPDANGRLATDGIVYLSNSRSFHRVTVPELYAALSALLPDDAAARVDVVYRNPHAGTRESFEALLREFSRRRTVVLLDNFEDAIKVETGRIESNELLETLRALLELPLHGLKVIMTTRVAPVDLALVEPGRQRRLDLDKGLEHPYAENVLRTMDTDGKLGLRDAPEALLAEARTRTRGNPRALEHLYGIVSADRDTTLAEILEDTKRLLPEQVVDVLVGEAFNRLDATGQLVMQALAAYRYPVPATAIDYLLQPYVPGVDSAPVLKRLVNMQFARREAGRYYVHQVDRDYALKRLLETPPLTRLALTHRAAEWFKQARKPREEWKALEDLAPLLSEFELRVTGGEYDAALSVLLEMDFEHLMFWGHFGLATELHERLQGGITDPRVAQVSVGNLGTAYFRMGKFEAAVSCYERALTVAREHGDRVNEAIWLGNIGSVYGDLGYGARAIEHHEQALAIDRDLKNKFGESRHLDNLADEYLVVGQGARALEHRQRALDIDRELKHPQEEAHRLANLGHTQFKLGNNVEARECLTEGHRIAERIGYRLIEMASLTFLGELLVDEGDLEGAVEKLRLSIDLADNAGVTQFQSEARIALARVHLYRTELTAARKAADAARQFDFPSSNDGACLAAGIIAVRQGDQDGAREALGAALRQADSLLSRNPQRVSSLDVKGLALCGLSLCDHIKHLSGARDAFAAARAPGLLAGSVRQVLRLFDALAAADTVGALQDLRPVAAGAARQTRTV